MAKGGDAGNLEALVGHKLVHARVAAAAHPDATAELLATLAGDVSRNVRRMVARRPHTPPGTLQALAADPDHATREAVATNARTPPGILISLLSDGHFDVRWAATTNPAVDLRVQQAICAAPYQDIRLTLAQQPHLPAEIVALLANDPAWPVREAVAEHSDDPAVLPILLNDPHPDVRAMAAKNPHTTAAQRRQLVHDRNAQVRAALVLAMATLGWDIPEEDLLLLARDRSANVRFWVASLPGSTRPVYEVLAQDADGQIATNARQWLVNPNNPAHMGNPSGEVLVGPGTRRRFPKPAQLGRPTPEISIHVLNQFLNR